MKKIFTYSYVLMSLFSITFGLLQSILDKQAEFIPFVSSIVAITTAITYIAIINKKISIRKKLYLDCLFLLFWAAGLGCSICGIVYTSNFLYLAIPNTVFNGILVFLVSIKILISVIKLTKTFNTHERKRRKLKKDEIFAILEKLKALYDLKILNDTEYENTRKNYIDLI